MDFKETHYQWEWDLQASPETLWPLVSNTNRFDRDALAPPVENLSENRPLSNARLQMRLSINGILMEYEQEPFEWIYPHQFNVTRNFVRGPLARFRMLVHLHPKPNGGTRLVYQIWVLPKNILGLIGIPFQMGIFFAQSFNRIFKKYDQLASSRNYISYAFKSVQLTSDEQARLENHRKELVDQGCDSKLVMRLIQTIQEADDIMIARLRPYELADYWGVPRKDMLFLFLLATRTGLLSFRWDLLCPLCRGAKNTVSTLGELSSEVHCASCNINFSANFERSVELTFRPSEIIRPIENREFCVGGPQTTPHIVVQKLLAPNTTATIQTHFEIGRYRLRAFNLSGNQALQMQHGGQTQTTLTLTSSGWGNEEPQIDPDATLTLANQTPNEHLFLLERTAWSDQALTAAEVTTLQTFRDLFSSEALRPGEQISVGSLAIVFTDLCDSTRMYQQSGDARAFGWVMEHFDILTEAVRVENGAIVKTIGDAIMAVFQNPAAGVRAILKAQTDLENAFPDQNIILKAGIHYGACIAVTLNERLDYFGSTVNMAARLEKFSHGNDIVLSEKVYFDPATQAMLNQQKAMLTVQPIEMATLKGFDDKTFQLWRIQLTHYAQTSAEH